MFFLAVCCVNYKEELGVINNAISHTLVDCQINFALKSIPFTNAI